MFWHSAASSNAIDSLLDQMDVHLSTILDQDEVLMEIRGMNKKLLEYLTRNDVMHELLDLITLTPSADVPIPLQYKFPNIACEVLTSDLSFVEKIAADPLMMDKLFHFFRDTEPPLNPLLASYVCRVLGEMVARKMDQNWYSYQLNLIQVMGCLRADPNLLRWLLKHVETSSVCDFFHKLVMKVEGEEMRMNLYDWLENREHFFSNLVNNMGRAQNKEAHMNICRLVGDLLFALQDEASSASQDRSSGFEPFLVALTSPATIEKLLDVILGEETLSQTSIVYGLDMLLALLGISNKPVKQSSKMKQEVITNEDVVLPTSVRETLIKKMPTLLRFLQCRPLSGNQTASIKLSNGVLEQPLGMERLAIVKFVSYIISLHDVDLNESLIQSGVLGKSLDLLWEHPWNNFLHHHVVQIVSQIGKITRSENCAKFLLIDYTMPEKIMTAFETENLKKAGYFGHLAKITEALIQSSEQNGCVKSVIQEMGEGSWSKFMEFCEGKWKAYNENATQLLAGVSFPSAGVDLNTSSQHDYESDPGITWEDGDSGAMGNAGIDGDDFYDASQAQSSNFFGSSDGRYGDEKSKSIFEMFCSERSNSAEDDEDEDRNDEGGAVSNSLSYAGDDNARSGMAEDDDFGNWNNATTFFKHLENQEKEFGQMTLGGTCPDESANSGSGSVQTAFTTNPWADQDSVHVDGTDPWATFEFTNFNNFPPPQGSDDADWAQFEQCPPISDSDNNDIPSFAEFGNSSGDISFGVSNNEPVSLASTQASQSLPASTTTDTTSSSPSSSTGEEGVQATDSSSSQKNDS